MLTRDGQIEFLRLNGGQIAACAWNGYQETGRGTVGVLSDLHNAVLRVVPFDFLPESAAAKLFKPWEGSGESRMVAGYDPTTKPLTAFRKRARRDAANGAGNGGAFGIDLRRSLAGRGRGGSSRKVRQNLVGRTNLAASWKFKKAETARGIGRL